MQIYVRMLTEIRLVAGLCPHPLGAPPDPLAAMGGATYKETDGKGEVGNSAMS